MTPGFLRLMTQKSLVLSLRMTPIMSTNGIPVPGARTPWRTWVVQRLSANSRDWTWLSRAFGAGQKAAACSSGVNWSLSSSPSITKIAMERRVLLMPSMVRWVHEHTTYFSSQGRDRRKNSIARRSSSCKMDCR